MMAFLALILVSGGIVVVGCLDERRRRSQSGPEGA